MHTARSSVAANWGPRAEPLVEAAGLLERFLHALARIDPALSGWRNAGGSKSEVLRQPLVIADRPHLQTRLLDGCHRNSSTDKVIEDLGYSMYWVNGDDGRSAANLSINIAATSSLVANSIVLNLPDSITTPGVYSRSAARILMRTLVETFRPDSVVWGNRNLYNNQKEPDRPTGDGGYILGTVIGHRAGWGNYLSDTESVKFDHAMLPASATVERIGDGTLVMVGDNPADPPLSDVLMVRAAMGYDVPTLNT
jgi:hypothetical protein